MEKRTAELMALLEKQKDIAVFIGEQQENFTEDNVQSHLEKLLSQYGVKKGEVINRSGLNQIYAYQIFSGTKAPSRDKLIQLALAFPLTLDDACRLLRTGGYAPFYPKNKRDAIIIFAFHHKLTVWELEDLLYGMAEATLTS